MKLGESVLLSLNAWWFSAHKLQVFLGWVMNPDDDGFELSSEQVASSLSQSGLLKLNLLVGFILLYIQSLYLSSFFSFTQNVRIQQD